MFKINYIYIYALICGIKATGCFSFRCTVRTTTECPWRNRHRYGVRPLSVPFLGPARVVGLRVVASRKEVIMELMIDLGLAKAHTEMKRYTE